MRCWALTLSATGAWSAPFLSNLSRQGRYVDCVVTTEGDPREGSSKGRNVESGLFLLANAL